MQERSKPELLSTKTNEFGFRVRQEIYVDNIRWHLELWSTDGDAFFWKEFFDLYELVADLQTLRFIESFFKENK